MQKGHLMRGKAPAIIVLAAAMAFTAGCQQQQQAPPNERQARLLATQSADLQRQLAAARQEIEALHQKYNQQLRRRDIELTKCKARIRDLQRDVEKGIAERAGNVAATVMQENAKLRQEIEQLKAQVEELRTAQAPGDVP